MKAPDRLRAIDWTRVAAELDSGGNAVIEQLIAPALAAGKVVILDFPPRSRRSKHGIATKDVLAELAAGGLDATVVDEELDDQYAIVATLRE